jgi:hypothetical protein
MDTKRPSTKTQEELTKLEKGLLSHKSRLEWNIKSLNGKLDSRTKYTIDLLKDNQCPQLLKEFYIIGDFWIKGFKMTELKEYTNKKGVKSMKHYIGNKYIAPQPKGTEPVLMNGWSIHINTITIELFDIDGDGMLIANKNKFERYYNSD